MTTNTGEPGSESGSEFRAKFEQTQAEAAGLRNLVAQQYGVDADKLKGVPVDQIETKVTELQAAQQAQEEQVLRKALGLGPEDDLAAALAKVKGNEPGATPPPNPAPASSAPFTSTGALGGTPPTVPQDQNLYGASRIRAGIAERKRNS